MLSAIMEESDLITAKDVSLTFFQKVGVPIRGSFHLGVLLCQCPFYGTDIKSL